MRNKGKQIFLALFMIAAVFVISACSSAPSAAGSVANGHSGNSEAAAVDGSAEVPASFKSDNPAHSAVDFNHELDPYVPLKNHYNFYFTYKTVHPW